MNSYKNIARKGILNSLSLAMYRISMLLMYMIAGNTMQIKDFALVTSVMTLVVTFQMLGTNGVTNSFNRFTSRYIDKEEDLIKYHSCMVVILLLMIVSLIIAMNTFLKLSEKGVYSDLDVEVYWFVNLFLILSIFSSGIKGVFYAHEEFKSIFKISLVSSVSLILCYLICIYFIKIKGLYSFFISVLFSVFIEFLTSIYYSKNFLKFSIKYIFLKEKIIIVLRFLIPSSLSSLIVAPINIYIVNFVSEKGSNLELVITNVLLQIRNIMLFIPSAFASLALTIISKSINQDEELKSLIKFILISVIIVACISVLFLVFDSYIYGLYGLEVFDSNKYLSLVLCSSVLFSVISLMLGQYITAKGHTFYGLLCNIAWATLLIISMEIQKLDNILTNVFSSYNLSYIFLSILMFLTSFWLVRNGRENRNSNNLV